MTGPEVKHHISAFAPLVPLSSTSPTRSATQNKFDFVLMGSRSPSHDALPYKQPAQPFFSLVRLPSLEPSVRLFLANLRQRRA